MSTSPDFQRTDDEITALISLWGTESLGNDELRKRIEDIGTETLAPGQRAAVEELLRDLRNALPGDRDALQPVMRRTLEELAYGE
jgi:hypothetical protein